MEVGKDIILGDRLPDRVVSFLTDHHVLTLAVAADDDIWCSHAFYIYLDDELSFLILSEEGTRHVAIAQKKPIVSGGVALETKRVGEIRGLQFKAEMVRCGSSVFDKYRLLYLKRFPYALFKAGDLWLLKVSEAKFTDNRLGFGKKIRFRYQKPF